MNEIANAVDFNNAIAALVAADQRSAPSGAETFNCSSFAPASTDSSDVPSGSSLAVDSEHGAEPGVCYYVSAELGTTTCSAKAASSKRARLCCCVSEDATASAVDVAALCATSADSCRHDDQYTNGVCVPNPPSPPGEPAHHEKAEDEGWEDFKAFLCFGYRGKWCGEIAIGWWLAILFAFGVELTLVPLAAARIAYVVP